MNYINRSAVFSVIAGLTFSLGMTAMTEEVGRLFDLVESHKYLYARSFYKDGNENVLTAWKQFVEVRNIFEENSDLIKARDENGNTFLHVAAKGCPDFPVIEFLLSAGGSELVNVQNNNGQTILHILCVNILIHDFHNENLRLSFIGNLILRLMEMGANPFIKDKFNKCAVNYANAKLRQCIINKIHEEYPKE